MDHVISLDELRRFNGFYRKPECRQAVFRLFKGVCQFCDRVIEGGVFHVAHVIARSRPALMERYFPGLDVDNLLNLKLSCPSCNLAAGDVILDAPHLLMHTFVLSARAIALRWAAIETRAARPEDVLLDLRGDDRRLCVDVLHLDPTALQQISCVWNGAWVLAEQPLREHISSALAAACGSSPGAALVSATMDDAVNAFDHHLWLSGSSMVGRARYRLAWWLAAWEQRSREVCAQGVVRTGERDGHGAAPDGIYLDAREIAARDGVWVALRDDTQRWFFRVLRTLKQIRLLVDAHTGAARHVVLDEDRWDALCACQGQLADIEAGLGIVAARRLKPPTAISFGVCDGVFSIGASNADVPPAVARACYAYRDRAYYMGAVVRRAALKAWLGRAFTLVMAGQQAAAGGPLVRVGDARAARWLPRLRRPDAPPTAPA